MNDQMRNEDTFIAVAEGLTKHFETGSVTVRAVDGVSFRLPRARIVALRGPSGCGKSTLLNLIGALDRSDSGQLTVDGVDVSNLASWDGANWESVGNSIDGQVSALGVFDDGSGATLFVGGEFEFVDDLYSQGVARWNGSSWLDMDGGLGIGGALGGSLTANGFAVLNDPIRPYLFIGGNFGDGGGVLSRGVARWGVPEQCP